jgi:hypothetical protein
MRIRNPDFSDLGWAAYDPTLILHQEKNKATTLLQQQFPKKLSSVSDSDFIRSVDTIQIQIQEDKNYPPKYKKVKKFYALKC